MTMDVIPVIAYFTY